MNSLTHSAGSVKGVAEGPLTGAGFGWLRSFIKTKNMAGVLFFNRSSRTEDAPRGTPAIVIAAGYQ
jgi:hypothetical protein